MRTSKLAWALTLGLALAMTAGAVSLVAPSGGTVAPANTQGSENGSTTVGVLADAPATNFADPWPTDASGVTVESSDTTSPDAVATIALVARWGYLNDPAVAALEGRWQFNDTKTGGSFLGQWHLVNGRLGGTLEGRFALPRSGDGNFRGTWTVTDSGVGGSLWGDWVRVNDTNGYFDGQWNSTASRGGGGALAGDWARFSDTGGGFRGRAITAPTMRPVDWDGSLSTTNGTVRLVRTLRFERDDHVLPQTNRTAISWESTTTVNWDGILAVLRLPVARPLPQVTLTTTQVSFTWNASELPGLHVYEQVDRAGHAIEVRGFLVSPPPCYCAAFKVGMRWGNLTSNGTGGGADTNWNGFAQITYGVVGLARPMSFERGDYLLLPMNLVTVSWRSNTGSADWDGVALGAIVPLRAYNDTYVTVHAGAFTHVFTLAELVGDHTYDMGGGNQVEIRAVRL